MLPEVPDIRLIPLSYPQLLIYLKADDFLEEQLGLAITGRTVSPQVKHVVQQVTLPAMRQCAGQDYLYHTFWLVTDNGSNAIVAEVGFKGPPDSAGEIEIGYGTMPGQEGNGYMTAAVHALLQWAAQQSGVQAVLAEIDEANRASVRVVEKNGFMLAHQKDNMLWWRKKLR